ncbi:hypothetical protein EVC30_046 [Rhizobium phage RHph_Y1_11]|nr:hypothetical protein EVC30_046 [Rhizobium phage RHph_Y1_11]
MAALAGVHVLCAFTGPQQARDKGQAIIGKFAWSEQPASNVATTNKAPKINQSSGQAIFRVRSTLNCFVSIGKTPNASTGIRAYVEANKDYDFYAEPDDKLAWLADA